MNYRLLRSFITWCLLTFMVLTVRHLIVFKPLSMSGRDAAVYGIAALAIAAIHFVVFRLPLITPGGRSPRRLRFLGQLLVRFAGLYLILVVWNGTTFALVHDSLSKQDLRALLTTNFSAAPLAVIFVFWVIFSDWWFAYALASRSAPLPMASNVIAPPLPSRQEKPSFLTLDIYPKR